MLVCFKTIITKAHTFSNPSNDMSQLNRDIGCLLGIHAPWKISEVTFAHEAQEVRIHVAYEDDHQLPCPEYGSACTGYDHRSRQWRHLDLCEYRTMVVAELPRVECPGAWSAHSAGSVGGTYVTVHCRV